VNSSAWTLVFGALLLLAGIGYLVSGNEGGSGWFMLVGGAGTVAGALLMRRQQKRSAGR
jgi:hypothetical protein